MSFFAKLKAKFAKHKSEIYAISDCNHVYINTSDSSDWKEALGECVATFGKNKEERLVIRILSGDPEKNGGRAPRVLYTFPVPANFPYEVQGETWHSWMCDGVYYGLDFTSASEAKEFSEAVFAHMPSAAPEEPPAVPPRRKASEATAANLKAAAHMHRLPSNADLLEVLHQAGVSGDLLEDEETRIIITEELDKASAQGHVDLEEEEEDSSEDIEQAANVKPRPVGKDGDSKAALEAEVERLKLANAKLLERLKGQTVDLARARARRNQYKAALIEHHIPLPPSDAKVPRKRRRRKKRSNSRVGQQLPPSPKITLPDGAPPTPPTAPPATPPVEPKEASPPARVGISAAALQGVTLEHRRHKDAPPASASHGGISAAALQGVKLSSGRKHPQKWATPDTPSKKNDLSAAIARRLKARRASMGPAVDYNDEEDSWSEDW